MHSLIPILFVALVACSRPTPSAEPAEDASLAQAAPSPVVRARPGRAEFVGSSTCASCHRAQSEAFSRSHHARALVKPSAELTKARFDGAHFKTKLGGRTEFSLKNGQPVVTTSSAGKAVTHPISYVSGVWPLEQYVVATERGKLQALSVTWDARTKAEGGAQWFHVYGPDGIAPDDPLYFTSPAQSWNHMCAECHSTWVERRYDVSSDSFDSSWAEESVGCEACHGPGAQHVASARAGGVVAALPAKLKASPLWTPSGSGSPTPHAQDGVEVEVCAPCHSRREPLKEGFLASDPFLDSFAPELLSPGRYHADGQVEGEVYEWASFLQSRMYQAGVRCSDCHDPHSGKPHAEGNALCVRCHEPTRFDAPAHSHHAGDGAPLCVDCHMPPSTFMQIDERRDHSIRIPRPDLSVELGTANACTGCHTTESPVWARDRLKGWFPASRPRAHFAEALAKDRKGTLDAPHTLRAFAEDRAVPAIARASMLERLAHYPTPHTVQTLQAALASDDTLVAYGAVLGAAQLPPRQRAALLVPALGRSARAVRVAAAKLLTGVPPSEVPPAARPALERAFAEVEQSFAVSASRAETHVEKSAFELARGHVAAAEASLQTALRLEPCLPEAYLNLADLARARGDEASAEKSLRAALACRPTSAAAHHALGLWQVRAHQSKAAIASLKRACELAPTDTRFAYVLAVALHGQGARDEALRVLEGARQGRPNDVSTLQALASFLKEAGQVERAHDVQRELDVVLRD